MSKDKENKITIDDAEYAIDEMTDEQKSMVNVIDLNLKVTNSIAAQALQINHQLDCLKQIGQARIEQLKNSLKSETTEGKKKDAEKSKE
jgi:hypothetical protein